jgi:hypothetical protein
MSLVGATVLAGGYGAATAYEAAADYFDPYVGFPLALTKQKFYLEEGQWPAPTSDYLTLQAAGVKWMLCVKPLRSAVLAGGSALAAEQANLAAAIAAYQPYEVCLWQECNQGSQTWFTSPEPTFQQYWNAYAPTVTAAGVPLVVTMSIGSQTSLDRAVSYFPSAGPILPAKCYYDWYASEWKPTHSSPLGFNPDTPDDSGVTPISIPDSLGIPVGLGEWGNSASGILQSQKTWNGYLAHLVTLFTTRIANGLVNADFGYYSGNGANDIVTGPTDYKVAGIRQVYELFSSGPGPVPPGGEPLTIPVFDAGYPPQPADFNNWIQVPFTFLTQKTVFRASLNNNAINLPTGQNTLIPFDTILEDPWSGWDVATSSWTCPAGKSGTYLVSVTGAAQGVSDPTATLQPLAGLNGTPIWTVNNTWAPSNQIAVASGSMPVQLYAGQDQVSGWLFWNASKDGQVSCLGGRRCTIEITWQSL